MHTDQEPTTSFDTRDRRIAQDSRSGELDRRGLELALVDALSDILRDEAARANQASRH